MKRLLLTSSLAITLCISATTQAVTVNNTSNLACLGISVLIINGSPVTDVQTWLKNNGGQVDPYTHQYGICHNAPVKASLTQHGDKVSVVGKNNNDALIIANVGNNVISATPIAGSNLTTDRAQGNNVTVFNIGGD